MNKDAMRFFQENPTEPYWYYSDHVRVPNPRLKPWQWEPRIPWKGSK